MKHTLIVIGWMGCKRAYLDVPREEAIRRYKETEGIADDNDLLTEMDLIKEFSFENNEFGVYDAWE